MAEVKSSHTPICMGCIIAEPATHVPRLMGMAHDDDLYLAGGLASLFATAALFLLTLL